MLACGFEMDQDLATGLLVRHRPGSWGDGSRRPARLPG